MSGEARVPPEETGWWTSYERALRLFRYAGRRDQVAEILARAGYGIRGEDDGMEILDAAGRPVDPRAVYAEIQADTGLQFELYQVSMDLGHRGY